MKALATFFSVDPDVDDAGEVPVMLVMLVMLVMCVLMMPALLMMLKDILLELTISGALSAGDVVHTQANLLDAVP